MEEIQKQNADFIQDYVLYNKDINATEVLRALASKKTHQIIVSNVINPSKIQIQLADNVNSLNTLMDELELVYCGIGASNFDIPVEYIELGHLCAAIYPGDNNWHRCRIIGKDLEKKKVRVSFIDYGGDSLVPIESIKFLASQFSALPIQAVDAKFANVTSNGKKWPKDTINYLLNKVTGKTLTAEVVGLNDGEVSLDIYDLATKFEKSNLLGSRIHLNQRIILDGYGKLYDEAKDLEVIIFY